MILQFKPFNHLICLLLFLFLFHQIAFNQSENLVLNPGFENVLNGKTDLPICKYAKNTLLINKRLDHWTTFEGQTPDLVLWEPGCFYKKPHGGSNMVGLITYHPGYDTGWSYDYHEFIQGQLKEPLKPGSRYQIEFFINQDDSTAVHHLKDVYGNRYQEIIPGASNNLCIWFLVNPLTTKEYMWDIVRFEAAIPQIRFYEPIATAPDEWKRMNSSFQADRPYRYFVVGNFFKDSKTTTNIPNSEAIDSFNLSKLKFWEKKKRVAYYCIDDVRIYKSDVDIPSQEITVRIDLSKSNTYTFQDVTFPSGQAILNNSSFKELDALTAYLNENQLISIEIGGHTDNIGSEEANLRLSISRAKAVHDYLLENGIEPSRISYQGYGESSPIETNDTPIGRKMNRRVEVKIIH